MARAARMIFSLSADTKAKLDELAVHMNLDSRSEVVRALIKRAHRQMAAPKP